MKFKITTIIIILLLILSIIFIFFIKTKKEEFSVESELNPHIGFYSQFFFLLNHYLYCKEQQTNFRINSENWMYKYENGWTDYFVPIELNFNNEDYSKKGHGEILVDYKLGDYQKAINEVYIYNPYVINEIEKNKKEMNLMPYEYDSIFIRRGDKLVDESSIIYEEDYLKLLLSINPECNVIFLQTDDYNSFTNLQDLIIKNNYDIKIYTLCEKNEVGTLTTKAFKNKLINNTTNFDKNKDYIKNTNYNLTKSVEEMNSDEIKRHALKMIIGVDIVRFSKYCVSDYQSNVGRFIKLAHSNPDSVYDVESKTNYIDYDKKICPAWQEAFAV